MSEQSHQTIARDGGKGRVLVPVPFDPDEVWQSKPRHHIAGTKRRPEVRAERIRQVVELLEAGRKERPK